MPSIPSANTAATVHAIAERAAEMIGDEEEIFVSVLSTQWVADSVARLFAARVDPAPRPDVRFPEVTGRTTVASIPTRHGATTATVYHPDPQNGRIPPVYVNIHGGGFVVGHPEQDDPWCRYLAAHANVAVVNPDYVLAPHRRFPAPATAWTPVDA